MSAKIQLGLILSAALGSWLSPEIAKAGPASDCGRKIKARDVVVLDLESFRGRPESAQEFVVQHAGEFHLLTAEIEEIRTRSRPSRDPDSVVRQARKFGARHGCDLVLVLKTGPYFGRQRGLRARIKEHGYAFVLMGQRIRS